MIALLSPAKRLRSAEEIRNIDYSLPKFIKEADIINQTLRKKSVNSLKKLHKISHELAQNNWERNQSWVGEGSKRVNAAVFMFDGEVYRGLNPQGWTNEELKIAHKKLRIISGLYGLLSPLDMIEPYRLEMGTPLRIKSKSNLYEFWRKKLSAEIIEIADNKPILELCSAEYLKVFDKKRLGDLIHNVEFLELKEGAKPKAVQVYLKQARGMMANFVVKNEIKDFGDLRAFDYEGYNFDNHLSTVNKSVFVRHHYK